MWWNFLSYFFLGAYCLMMALMGTFRGTPYLDLECKEGVRG